MQPSTKQTQLILFASFVGVVGLLYAFVGQPRAAMMPIGDGTLALALSAGAAIGCVGWTLARLRASAPIGETPALPTPERVQTDMLTGLAFAELPTLVGLFIGPGRVHPLAYAGLSWFLMIAVVLPPVLSYWRRQETL